MKKLVWNILTLLIYTKRRTYLGVFLESSTGSLIDGELSGWHSLSGSNIALRYPKFDFQYAKTVGKSISTEAGIGGVLLFILLHSNTVARINRIMTCRAS
jgi:hypothetical protein